MSGIEKMKEAQDHLKDTTLFFGIFGDPPNPLMAVEEFTTAANILIKEKQYEMAVSCHCKAADLHGTLGSAYLSGRSFESAANLVETKLDDLEKVRLELIQASIIFKKASDQFLLSGAPDKAAELIEKAARSLNTIDQPRAFILYQESLTLLESEDRVRFGLDTFSRCLSFCLASNNLVNATIVSARIEDAMWGIRNKHGYQRQVLMSVLIHLCLKDETNALERWNQSLLRDPSMSSSRESNAIKEFLQAYQSCSQDAFDEVLKASKIVPYLEVQVVKMATRIEVPKESEGLKGLQDEIEEDGYL